MQGNYFQRVTGFIFAVLMFAAVAFIPSVTVQAQERGETRIQGRRGVVVRPHPHRIYRRPFGYRYRYNRWGYPYWYNRWGYDPWSPFAYNSWGYDPWSPYGSRYRQYVFRDSESAVKKGYEHGFKTGKSDGKKAKSYKPERSHYYHDAGFGNYAEVYRSAFSNGYSDGYRTGTAERAR